MARRSFKIGETLVGVRTTSEAFGAWMDGALGRYATTEDAPTAISIVVSGGDDGSTAAKRFHILYSGSWQLVRTLDLPTLGRSLVSEMQMALYPARDDAIYVDASIVAVNGVNVLMPSMSMQNLARLGRRIEREGIHLPVARTSAVDRRSGRVIPPPQPLEVADRSIEDLKTLSGGNGRADRKVLDRAASVDVIYWQGGVEQEGVERVSRARALGHLGAKAINLPELGRSALDGLTRLVQGADCYSYRVTADSRELLRGLTHIVRS